ncbi:IS3 family transposase [Anaerocolumna jejuensis]|uniref:IS3 family transposase n=1 Tax=Anaerocolumna jejuensis TaxID=259063 RepID=UPI003F7BD02A
MPRNRSSEEKLQAVKEYLSGKGSIEVIAEKYSVSSKPFRKWIAKYKSFGDAAFIRTGHNQSYSKEFKQMVINSYLADKGYRRIRDDLERYHDIKANDKRVLRICRKQGIKSTIKYSNNGCTRQTANPQYIAENILHREFTAEAPNEKWLTDVTEFHYYTGIEKHKVYLSAILDLYDRRIVSYIIRDSNNNALVFDTFNAAIKVNPDAHPLFHSDRGFQYTNRVFHTKLEKAGMIQSMSRVAKCIDNGPMEGF